MTCKTQTFTGTARAKFFAGFGPETLKVRVEADGSVLPWDSVAGHYTRCHSLSAGIQKRIARKIRATEAGHAR